MKRYAFLIATAVLLVLATPAHAVSNPDATVNAINSSFRTTTVTRNAVGGGGGQSGGTTPGEVCNASPENATVLLALLSGAGLLLGRRMRRVHIARVVLS